jgi:hypothetical protein
MQASNFHNEDERSRVTSRPPQLGEVVRDAMDHAQVIARDTVTLGRLEAEHVIALAKDEARTAIAHARIEAHLLASKARVEGKNILTRVAIGAIATAVGAVGITLLCIAIFLGLGAIIPSLAVRFGLFGVVFVAVATIAAHQVRKNQRVSVRHPDERLRHLVPMHHIDDEV